MRFFISISYNGADFSGWQIQNNGPSIQEAVEKVLSIQLREETKVVGAGRTDARVNAVNYIAHFDSDNEIILKNPQLFIYKTNATLPRGIVVTDLYPVKPDAHARFDATEREYRYFIHLTKDPFVSNFSYFCKHRLDLERMNRAAAFLIGKKDFSSFEKLHSGNLTSICEVRKARWEYLPRTLSHGRTEDYLCFTISANRFLRNMVRAIVGSLVEVGRGRKEPQWIAELIEKKDRCAAGGSVPGHALFLTGITYPYELESILNNK